MHVENAKIKLRYKWIVERLVFPELEPWLYCLSNIRESDDKNQSTTIVGNSTSRLILQEIEV